MNWTKTKILKLATLKSEVGFRVMFKERYLFELCMSLVDEGRLRISDRDQSALYLKVCATEKEGKAQEPDKASYVTPSIAGTDRPNAVPAPQGQTS